MESYNDTCIYAMRQRNKYGFLLPLASPLPFQCRGLSNKVAADSSCEKAGQADLGSRQVQHLLKPFLITRQTKKAKFSTFDSSIVKGPENTPCMLQKPK